MAVSFASEHWRIERPETELDRFVDSFIRMFESANVSYVLVSGYVAILFGRSRNSEDVDVFINDLPYEAFLAFWNAAMVDFECVNAVDPHDAFANYLSEGIAIRFGHKDRVIPNMEVRFPKTELDRWTLARAVNAELNGRSYRISPLELQIPYKLYLGSDKDLEDARHLWRVTREHLRPALLRDFLTRLDRNNFAQKWLT